MGNYIAIVLAALTNVIIGALWYSPALFGKTWQKEMGYKKKDMNKMKKKAGQGYFWMTISSLVMAYVLGHFLTMFKVATFSAAAQLAFWLWLGFIATVTLGGVLWEGRSCKLYCLNASYWLVSLCAMSIAYVNFS
jgi:hypothetical protein